MEEQISTNYEGKKKELSDAQNKMNDLLTHMINEKYKLVCDRIKVEILNSLISIMDKREDSEGKPLPIISKYDLILIRDGVEELLEKENKEQAEAMATVIGEIMRLSE